MSRGVVVAVACAVLAAAVFVGLAIRAPARVALSTRASDAAGEFSVGVPTGWRADASGPLGTVLLLYGPRYGDVTVNVNVIEQHGVKISLDEYAAVSKKSGPGMVPGFRVLSQGWTTLGGLRAVELVYEAKPLGEQMQAMGVFTIRDNTAYLLTYSAPASCYARHVKQFQAVVRSFTWT